MEEEQAEVEDIELADDGLMPVGEVPLTLREARDILGRRSNSHGMGR